MVFADEYRPEYGYRQLDKDYPHKYRRKLVGNYGYDKNAVRHVLLYSQGSRSMRQGHVLKRYQRYKVATGGMAG
jgi:hypothetical protein